MISQIKQKGFTIVELLIVIVVIAILAAISMAAYTNITARANTSTAAAAAKSVKDVANAYNTSNSGYPTTKAQFTSGGADAVAKLPADVTFKNAKISAQPTSAEGPKTVSVQMMGSATAPTGYEITYWDYAKGSAVSTTIGDGTLVTTNGFVQ